MTAFGSVFWWVSITRGLPVLEVRAVLSFSAHRNICVMYVRRIAIFRIVCLGGVGPVPDVAQYLVSSGGAFHGGIAGRCIHVCMPHDVAKWGKGALERLVCMVSASQRWHGSVS